MFARMTLVVLFACAIAGCATSSKKQATQSQSVVAQKTQQGLYDDQWSSDSYEMPEQKAYSTTVVKLSPKQIQRALKSAGFYQGPIDGKIGPKTKQAIIKFQKANGLKADGIVGKRTSVALNKYLSE
ncbi:MAG: peptidoglycan-binding domain-containing protein [Candidatus Omnitrophota bacterium]